MDAWTAGTQLLESVAELVLPRISQIARPGVADQLIKLFEAEGCIGISLVAQADIREAEQRRRISRIQVNGLEVTVSNETKVTLPDGRQSTIGAVMLNVQDRKLTIAEARKEFQKRVQREYEILEANVDSKDLGAPSFRRAYDGVMTEMIKEGLIAESDVEAIQKNLYIRKED